MRESPARNTALASERGTLQRPLDRAIAAYVREAEVLLEDRLLAAE